MNLGNLNNILSKISFQFLQKKSYLRTLKLIRDFYGYEQ